MLLLLALASCGGTPPSTAQVSRSQETIQWEPIRRWSGRGDERLDSFQSDSGALRVEWEAKAIAGASAPAMKIVIHSAISGRPLAAPILDQRGEGKGTVYFSEEPRVFFLDISSKDVEWKVAVAERVR